MCFRISTFDALGRVVRAELPDGNVVKLKYNAYDDIIHAEDRQHRVSFGYTPLGNPIWREEKNRRIELTYNQEEELAAVTNERGERHEFTRDANGNIIEEKGFDGAKRQYIRRTSGLLERVERPGGRWTAYKYDEMGRVIESSYSDGLVERFSYNLLGALTKASNPYTTVKLEYDRMGRVTKEWQDAYWIESRYIELGSRSGMTSSLGTNLKLERDDLGQVSRTEATAGDRTDNPWNVQIQYNALGQEIERLLPGEAISSWQYDTAGRAEHHSVKTGGRESRRRCFNWDINNRLKSITDNLTNKQTSFLYDDFGALIGSTGVDRLFRMSDDVGNLYSSSHRTDRKYGVGGQLLEFNAIR